MADDKVWTSFQTQVAISRKLLADHAYDLDKLIVFSLDPSPEAKERREAEQETRGQEWDRNVAAGLVPVEWCGECHQRDFSKAPRGAWVDKWVSAEVWDNYEEALAALETASEPLDG
jgi:hypothetical protein